MTDRLSAMISSTTLDLHQHRDRARDACLRQGFFPLLMEHLPPSPEEAERVSLDLVDKADIYVLVMGFRYGSIAPGRDKSFTHLELDRAIERGIPVLVFLMTGAHLITFADVDTGDGAERVTALREWLKEKYVVGLFSSPEELRSLLIAGLSDIRLRGPRAAAASFHHVRSIPAAPEPYIAHPYTLLQVAQVIGRQRELNFLTDWAADPAGSPVMIFVAIGGMGKSAVTWKWFNEIAPEEMKSLAGRVWWSFYESDAHFDNFVTRTLAYVSGEPIDMLAMMSRTDQETALLNALNRERYLIVLDGLERLLLAYSRGDAAHLADDDVDVAATSGAVRSIGASDGVTDGDQARLKATADPRVGRFLKRLTQLEGSRVLATSRLCPMDLTKEVTGEPLSGVAVSSIDGLSDNDAVGLWRKYDVSGQRDELIAVFNTFGNYPLLIRALAGAVSRFRPAPGDFQQWQRANPGFDPFTLPLVQRKSHVLKYAMADLTGAESRVLYTTAAFRSPATWKTLKAVLVGDRKPCSDDADLARVLTVLEDRGLLGWDKKANRYDLHPVVRGVTWAVLDPAAKKDIYARLASHFEALPAENTEPIASIDDLTGAIELYHVLVRQRRVVDAMKIFEERIFRPAAGLPGALRECTELIEPALEDPQLMSDLLKHDRATAIETISKLGAVYIFYGDAGRAQSYFHRLLNEDLWAQHLRMDWVYSIWSLILCSRGKLSLAELSARNAANREAIVRGLTAYAIAITSVRRGDYESGRSWFSRNRVHTIMGRHDYQTTFGAPDLLEPAIIAIREGDTQTPGQYLKRISERARNGDYPLVTVHQKSLEAAIAQTCGDCNRATELLNDALAVARHVKNSDSEVALLIQFADTSAALGRLDDARSFVSDAIQFAKHFQLRLRQSDAANVLSRIEHLAGNREAAAQAALTAYQLAWCDGPPFSYEWGIRQARENLDVTGEPEPTNLPPYSPIEMPDLRFN